jgi:hypothetical protein
MDWLSRRIMGEPEKAQLPLPAWMRRTPPPPSRRAKQAPLPHSSLVMVEDQDGPLISVAARR